MSEKENKFRHIRNLNPWFLRYRCSALPTELSSQLGAISQVHLEPTETLAVGLLAQLVEQCTGIAEVIGSNPVHVWIFFRPYFHYCLSSVYNCEGHFYIRFSTAVHIYDFHIFTVIYSPLHGFIWNQLNNQRSTNWANKPTGNHFKGFTGLFGAILNTGSWIVSSVGRALHRNRKGHGFKSRTSDCEDRFHIRFFNRSSHIWFYSRFIISWLNSCRLV